MRTETDSETSLLRRELAAFRAEVQETIQRQSKEIAALRKTIGRMRQESISTDIAPVLTAISRLWTKIPAGSSSTSQHGHALLIDALVDYEAADTGTLARQWLVEIGTTRELMTSQRSTQKLALFAALFGMRFTTVDMDEKNTRAAHNMVRVYSDGADFVCDKGENFLVYIEDFPQFIYLDAFDYYHDHHSKRRIQRYREVMGVSITNEDCWAMHLDCAETIFARMRRGGLVAFDDTWTDTNGAFDGKGKLAVPFLMQRGFEIRSSGNNCVLMQRISGNDGS